MNKALQLSIAALLLIGGSAFRTAAQAPPDRHWQRPGGAPPPGPPGARPSANPAPSPQSASSAYATIPAKKNAAGEQFFIVASLDLQNSQLLLKYPTEVTALVKVTPQTKIAAESGNSIKLGDLRAGDTLWVTASGSGDAMTAVRIRKGQMTVADLHRYYLDYEAIK